VLLLLLLLLRDLPVPLGATGCAKPTLMPPISLSYNSLASSPGATRREAVVSGRAAKLQLLSSASRHLDASPRDHVSPAMPRTQGGA
jgi:hypothetical protein